MPAFGEIAGDNEKINGIEIPTQPFYPENEVDKISELKGEPRAEALAGFKDRLVRQQIGVAKMQEAMIAAVKEDPDIDWNKVRPIVCEYAAEYGLTRWQERTAQKRFHYYTRKHEAVYGLRARFRNDADLFFTLFSSRPLGRVEIETGPATFYIKCFDEKRLRFCLLL